MANDTTTWEWIEAQPGRLEQQWTALRHADTKPAENGREEHAGRAVTVNLVVHAADAADAEQVAATLWALGPRHPARAFLIIPGSGGRGRLALQPRGSELLAVTMEPERAASLVAPLLQSDLPTLVWWRGERPIAAGGPTPAFQPWLAFADRVLVDARRWQLRPEELAGWGETLGPNVHLADLTWTRVTPWRQLVCQGVEADPRALGNITRLRLASGTAAGEAEAPPSLAATMLAGWMARQLQWQLEARPGPRTLRFSSQTGGPAVTVEFASVPGGDRPARLHRLQLESTPGGAPATAVAIEHHPGHLSLEVRRAGALLGRWAGAASADLRTETEALCEELSVHGPDPLYQQSLASGCAILEHLESAA